MLSIAIEDSNGCIDGQGEQGYSHGEQRPKNARCSRHLTQLPQLKIRERKNERQGQIVQETGEIVWSCSLHAGTSYSREEKLKL
jgi:hypothetical protein